MQLRSKTARLTDAADAIARIREVYGDRNDVVERLHVMIGYCHAEPVEALLSC